MTTKVLLHGRDSILLSTVLKNFAVDHSVIRSIKDTLKGSDLTNAVFQSNCPAIALTKCLYSKYYDEKNGLILITDIPQKCIKNYLTKKEAERKQCFIGTSIDSASKKSLSNPRVFEKKITRRELYKAAWLAYEKAPFFDALEKTAQYLRPREKHRGTTEKILETCFIAINDALTSDEIIEAYGLARQKLLHIPKKKVDFLLSIGLVGEPCLIFNEYIGKEIETMLSVCEIEVKHGYSHKNFLHNIYFEPIPSVLKPRRSMAKRIPRDVDGLILFKTAYCLEKEQRNKTIISQAEKSKIPLLVLEIKNLNSIENQFDLIKDYCLHLRLKRSILDPKKTLC